MSQQHLYVDESIHSDAGFIIAACCYFEDDPHDFVSKALSASGFDPENDEFSSHSRYAANEKYKDLRKRIREIACKSKFGVVVIPAEQRPSLGGECLKGIEIFVRENGLDAGINIHFDEGILSSSEAAKHSHLFPNLHPEQNSLKVGGIQIADYLAHSSSIQLKAAMGLVSKLVKLTFGGSEREMELEAELWLTTRTLLFRSERSENPDSAEQSEFALFRVEPYGLYISEYCSTELARLAREVFSSTYVGCAS